jgi:hypothetical protein
MAVLLEAGVATARLSTPTACAELCTLRHMLAEDVEAVVARAGRQYDLFQTPA